MQGVVFCDLDKTLISKNSSFGFGVFLYRKGILSLPKALLLTVHYASFSIGAISANVLHQRCFALLFKGQHKRLLHALAEDYVESELVQYIVPKVADYLKRMKEDGSSLHLLSTSPDFLVEIFGRRFGFDSSCGTEFLATKEGIYEKVGQVMDGEFKAVKAGKIAAGLREHQETYALTDSVHDFKLLLSVLHPIVVNPSRPLRREAESRGWQIIDS